MIQQKLSITLWFTSGDIEQQNRVMTALLQFQGKINIATLREAFESKE